ncbi:MAG: APC family permease [Fimbriimonas sp.]|nr:APC family permease [Fimbriimonas sp.]
MSFLDRLLGKPIATRAEEDHKVGVWAAVPMLGLDALGSAAYGPEAALTLLLPLGAVGLGYIGPISAIIIALLGILYVSYRQTMEAYPGGGGSYTVAKDNLGTRAGLLAAAALLVDYILTAAVGISAGVGALVSAVPSLLPQTLPICIGVLLLITVVNLRGIRESGVVFALPTYVFIVSLLAVLGIGVYRTLTHGGHPIAVDAPPMMPAASAGASLWLLAKAFASGCTAMTGVEAVSNGISVFSKPGVKRAQSTLTVIVVVLGVLLAGIAYLCAAYRIGATAPDGPGYQSVLSQLTAAVIGRGVAYYITIGSVLAVLALSANTGFADFPRLCRLLAEDEFLPHTFANRGRRLVYTWGICILAVLTGAILIVFGGVTDRLIPLFAIGAFLAFTLSQAGMVQHWRHRPSKANSLRMAVNGLGAAATAIAITVILVAKFAEGAWVTFLLILGLYRTFSLVKKHYAYVERETECRCPIVLGDLKKPIVLVPVGRWSTISEKALRFALSLSDDVMALHISFDPDKLPALQRTWQVNVDEPCRVHGIVPPSLVIVSSPYRRLFSPLLSCIHDVQIQHADRTIAIVLPELVEHRWYQYLLHNQRATWLKAALLLSGDRNVVVVNVPWYLGK